MMPEIKIYTSNETLPAHYDCQARSFIRMVWHDAYFYDWDAPIFPPERHPQHIVLAERDVLISYAQVTWAIVEHAGQSFKLYDLGNVMTYPAFRGKGYGRQVVDAATSILREDADADAAILFTDPERQGFYQASGWEHIAGLTATVGNPEDAVPHNYFSMMLFLSEKATQARPTFETQTIMLPGYGW